MSATQTRTQTLQAGCINKADRNSDHEGIIHVGGSGWR
ncbi:MAG: hypothetical protein QOF73_4842, partial [Thermomicrobiales bacterium]|nr:hypothetical protein [Thermomicrobiales bacterium]